jgi:hypothetical protein
MKPPHRALCFLLLALICGPVIGSEEDIRPWQSVTIKADGPPETGDIRVEAEVSAHGFASFRIHAFGREEALTRAELEKLRGYPLASISVTSEPGYESIGGYTVHARLKRTFYDDAKKLKTEVTIISLPKKGTIKVMKMPESNPG